MPSSILTWRVGPGPGPVPPVVRARRPPSVVRARGAPVARVGAGRPGGTDRVAVRLQFGNRIDSLGEIGCWF